MAKLIDGETPEAPKKETAKSPLTLSQEEMKKIEEDAKAEVQAELREKMAKDYKEQAKAKARKAELFKHAKDEKGADTEAVYVNLASHCEDVRLDGTRYLHGRTYHVPRNVAAVIKEQADRSWRHQAEVTGQDEHQLVGRQPRHVNVSGRA